MQKIAFCVERVRGISADDPFMKGVCGDIAAALAVASPNTEFIAAIESDISPEQSMTERLEQMRSRILRFGKSYRECIATVYITFGSPTFYSVMTGEKVRQLSARGGVAPADELTVRDFTKRFTAEFIQMPENRSVGSRIVMITDALDFTLRLAGLKMPSH